MKAMARFPDSPAGRQALWFVDQIRSGGAQATVVEVAAHMALPEPWTPEDGLERFTTAARAALTVESVVTRSPFDIDVIGNESGTPRLLSIAVEQVEPHRIIKV